MSQTLIPVVINCRVWDPAQNSLIRVCNERQHESVADVWARAWPMCCIVTEKVTSWSLQPPISSTSIHGKWLGKCGPCGWYDYYLDHLHHLRPPLAQSLTQEVTKNIPPTMVGMFKNQICILHVIEAKKYCDKESVSKCECQIKCALKLLHLIFLSNSICAI